MTVPSDEREAVRFLLILAIQALADALYKESRMGEDDEMGIGCLRSGAGAATAILQGEGR